MFSMMTQAKEFSTYHRLKLHLQIVLRYHIREGAAVSPVVSALRKHSCCGEEEVPEML